MATASESKSDMIRMNKVKAPYTCGFFQKIVIGVASFAYITPCLMQFYREIWGGVSSENENLWKLTQD